MAAAGYIPIVGWAGRIFKGGKAVYSTGKAIYKADKALEIYKTPKTFHALESSQKGLYGLVSANGLSEGITGRDMFGNKISKEQQHNSINAALAVLCLSGQRVFPVKQALKLQLQLKTQLLLLAEKGL